MVSRTGAVAWPLQARSRPIPTRYPHCSGSRSKRTGRAQTFITQDQWELPTASS